MMTKATLAAYILSMMKVWSPPADQIKFSETEADAEARYASIADDVAEVVLAEDSIFPESSGGKAKTAVLMAGLAFKETRFWKYVDSGQCNDYTWRKTPEGKKIIYSYGHCDGGLAWSMWQVHIPNKGFNVNGDLIDGPRMVSDRKAAVRVALRLAKRAMAAGHLCAYTGETNPDGTCTPLHPKATERLNFAVNYYVAHPFKE